MTVIKVRPAKNLLLKINRVFHHSLKKIATPGLSATSTSSINVPQVQDAAKNTPAMTLLLDNHISSVSSNSSESESDSESSLCDTLTSSAAKKATGIKSLCSAVFFDIGEVNFNQPLPESVKKSVLLEKFQPSKNWKGPLKTVGNKQRRVPSSMFNSNVYPFMSYSVKADGVFCAACSVFASGTTCAFIREPHSDWSNIDRHAQRHIKSLTHLSSIQAAYAFISVCEGKSVSVKQQLSQAYNDKVQRNTAALQSIIKTIILCGQQNIPMRGKSDDRSNFMALLNFRAEHDLALSEHLRIASGNSKYISHRIQNELVALCGNQIRDKIVKECIAAKYFSIIVDETTDVSVKEQVSLNLLFTTSDAKRHEEFVSFEETSDTTGETLYNLITGKLQELGLDIRNIVGLGFDGAANMSGKVKGVRGRFQHVGTAEYVHCRSHTLNLAIVNTCSEGAVRNMYNTVSETVNFITASAKRLNIYTNSSHGEDSTRLKKFCATRWTRHEETLQRFEENICIILETLAGLTQDHDRQTSVKANGLQLLIQNFQFIYTLVVVHRYLRYTKPISYSLQSVDQNLVRASSECKELIDFLKLKRSNDDSCNSLFDEASKLAQKLNVEVKAPRVTARQQYRSNAHGPTN